MSRIWALPGFYAFIAATFLNAFLDLGHKIILQNTIHKAFSGEFQLLLNTTLNALILLPFILLFLPAGTLADRFPRNVVMRFCVLVNIAIAALIALTYYMGWFWASFALCFVGAIQSAFYSPAKFGYIKDIVGKGYLTYGNGVIQAAAIIAMLSAMSLCSLGFEALYPLANNPYVIVEPGVILTTIAPLGLGLVLLSLLELKLTWNLPQKTGLKKSESAKDSKESTKVSNIKESSAGGLPRSLTLARNDDGAAVATRTATARNDDGGAITTRTATARNDEKGAVHAKESSAGGLPRSLTLARNDGAGEIAALRATRYARNDGAVRNNEKRNDDSIFSTAFNLKKISSDFKRLKKQKIIIAAFINIAIFWAIAQLLIATFPVFVKDAFGELNTFKIQTTLACAGIGTIFGSIIAGRTSKHYIETGLIPLGGIIAFGALFTLPALSSFSAFSIAFFAFGLGAALLIVPFNALIQYHAQDNELGNTLAYNNLAQSLLMLAFLALGAVFAWAALPIGYLFLFMIVTAFFAMVYVVKLLPFSLVRLLVSAALLQRYRLSVYGFEHIPKKGGVLLLGNHISFIDWAIVQMAMPRKVYFVMEKSYFNRWYINIFMEAFGVIPISETSSKAAIEKVREHLKDGKVVCIFPEGVISRHGQLNEFKSGFELIAKGLESKDAVILPFFIRGLWGSIFSRSNEQFRERKRSFSKKSISIAFGEKMEIHANKALVKSKVTEMSFKAWEHQCERLSTIGDAWINAAIKGGGDVAIVDSASGAMSYDKLLALTMLLSVRFGREVSKVADLGEMAVPSDTESGEILTRSLRPLNQSVGIMLPASLGSVLANFSLILAGKIVVNLNFTAGQSALDAAVAMAEIEHVYTSRVFLEKLAQKGTPLTFAKGVNVHYLEDILEEVKANKAVVLGYMILARIAPRALLRKLFSKNHNPQSVAAILFSSGSEDRPKGVMLSHLNILSNIAQIADVMHARNDDIMLGSLPPFHAFGLTVGGLMPFLENMLVATHADPTDAIGIAKTIIKNKVTIMCATSTILGMYARNAKLDPLMFAPLRLVVAGAEKLKQDVKDNFSMKFSKIIYEGYGTTETTPVVSVNLPNEFDEVNWQVHKASKEGSVGMPLPGTAIRIVDPNTMESLGVGEDGLILIGGHQVMVGYLKDRAKTKEAIVELDGIRWYKSGDKGHLDAEGFLHITDRYSRFAKIGGEMVSLAGLEEDIAKISKELGTFEHVKCLAVALEDGKKGERIVLLLEEIKPCNERDCVGALIAAIKGSKILALAKPSMYLEVESIPMLGSGKADLKGARDLATELIATRLGALV